MRVIQSAATVSGILVGGLLLASFGQPPTTELKAQDINSAISKVEETTEVPEVKVEEAKIEESASSSEPSNADLLGAIAEIKHLTVLVEAQATRIDELEKGHEKLSSTVTDKNFCNCQTPPLDLKFTKKAFPPTYPPAPKVKVTQPANQHRVVYQEYYPTYSNNPQYSNYSNNNNSGLFSGRRNRRGSCGPSGCR